MICFATYALMMSALIYIVAGASITMWRSNDRETAVFFGSVFGILILVLVFGPFL